MKVKFSADYARTVGIDEYEIYVHSSMSIGELLSVLLAIFPNLHDLLPEKKDSPIPSRRVQVMVNDRVADPADQVKDGDVLELRPISESCA